MNAREALLRFLDAALQTRWRARLVEFAGKSRTEAKFLDTLYHDFGKMLNDTSIVNSLPDTAWKQAAFSYSSHQGFGVAEESLASAHERPDDAILVVTCDGTSGFYREESYVDSEVLVSASGA